MRDRFDGEPNWLERNGCSRYFGLVMGSPCTPVVSASATNVDATLHRLPIETPIPMLWKAAFLGCAIVFAALAWLPANAMTRTSLGGHTEHLIAYLGAATLMGFATRTTPRLVVLCLLLIGYAAILEAGQFYAVGRQASLQDFAFSSSGVLIGAMLVWIARTCGGRVRILKHFRRVGAVWVGRARRATASPSRSEVTL
jgi:VanZ family protein